MTIKKQLRHYVGRKATRRIYKAMPWVGGAVALVALSSASGRRMFGDPHRALDTLPSSETLRSTAVDRPDFIRSAIAK